MEDVDVIRVIPRCVLCNSREGEVDVLINRVKNKMCKYCDEENTRYMW